MTIGTNPMRIKPPMPPIRECKNKDDALKISMNARREIANQTKKTIMDEILKAAIKGEYYIDIKMNENLDCIDQDNIVKEIKDKGFEVDYKYNCLGSKITIKWYE